MCCSDYMYLISTEFDWLFFYFNFLSKEICIQFRNIQTVSYGDLCCFDLDTYAVYADNKMSNKVINYLKVDHYPYLWLM